MKSYVHAGARSAAARKSMSRRVFNDRCFRAAVIAIDMLFAIGLVHGAEFFTRNQTGGWALELQGMFLSAAVAIALIGPGHYRVNDR